MLVASEQIPQSSLAKFDQLLSSETINLGMSMYMFASLGSAQTLLVGAFPTVSIPRACQSILVLIDVPTPIIPNSFGRRTKHIALGVHGTMPCRLISSDRSKPTINYAHFSNPMVHTCLPTCNIFIPDGISHPPKTLKGYAHASSHDHDPLQSNCSRSHGKAHQEVSEQKYGRY